MKKQFLFTALVATSAFGAQASATREFLKFGLKIGAAFGTGAAVASYTTNQELSQPRSHKADGSIDYKKMQQYHENNASLFYTAGVGTGVTAIAGVLLSPSWRSMDRFCKAGLLIMMMMGGAAEYQARKATQCRKKNLQEALQEIAETEAAKKKKSWF